MEKTELNCQAQQQDNGGITGRKSDATVHPGAGGYLRTIGSGAPSEGQSRNRRRIGAEPFEARFMPMVLHCVDTLAGRIELTPEFVFLLMSTLDEEASTRLLKELDERRGFSIGVDIPVHERAGETAVELRRCCQDETKGPSYLRLCEPVFLEAFYAAHDGCTIEDPLAARALELQDHMSIGETEALFLALLYAQRRISALADVLNDRPLHEYLAAAALLLGSSADEMKRITSASSRLVTLKMVQPDFFPPPHFAIAGPLLQFFDHDTGPFRFDSFAAEIEGPTLPLESYPIGKENLEMARRILASDMRGHILLHGVPGTGKSELSRSLVRACGRKGFVLKNETRDGGGDEVSRRLALTVMARRCADLNSVLVVDEADRLLNTEGLFISDSEKGWLVEFFDTSPAKIIWITNSIENLHPAVARRFTYSIGFRHFTDPQRRQVWSNLLEHSPLARALSRETVDDLSREFPVDAGGISLALSVADSLSPAGCALDASAVLRQVLQRHGELTGRVPSNSMLKPLHNAYDPSFLNLDIETAQLAASLSEYLKVQRDAPLTLLFWGPPGTGKTEYAKYLARQCGRSLAVYRASDLISRYIGETEERISAAFRQAEADQALLLLDEADSFFLDRTTSRHSWERTQTNELLTRMENFRGVLICCTNHLDLLDRAVLRRFSRKVHFSPLKSEAKVGLFERFFCSDGLRLSEQQRRRIASLRDLTPGDLYTVESTLAFRGGQCPGVDELIDELVKECTYRSGNGQRVMGFSA